MSAFYFAPHCCSRREAASTWVMPFSCEYYRLQRGNREIIWIFGIPKVVLYQVTWGFLSPLSGHETRKGMRVKWERSGELDNLNTAWRLPDTSSETDIPLRSHFTSVLWACGTAILLQAKWGPAPGRPSGGTRFLGPYPRCPGGGRERSKLRRQAGEGRLLNTHQKVLRSSLKLHVYQLGRGCVVLWCSVLFYFVLFKSRFPYFLIIHWAQACLDFTVYKRSQPRKWREQFCIVPGTRYLAGAWN